MKRESDKCPRGHIKFRVKYVFGLKF